MYGLRNHYWHFWRPELENTFSGTTVLQSRWKELGNTSVRRDGWPIRYETPLWRGTQWAGTMRTTCKPLTVMAFSGGTSLNIWRFVRYFWQL